MQQYNSWQENPGLSNLQMHIQFIQICKTLDEIWTSEHLERITI